MSNRPILILVSVAILVGAFVAGLSYGDKRGYNRAQAEVKKLQAEAAQKATEEAAKVANPFKAVNPLEGVEANPFEKAKNLLNPFK